MKKFIFFETTNASPHLETSLELAKRHLDRGDLVQYFFLGHAVSYTEFVVAKRKTVLFNRCLPERKGIALIAHKNLSFFSPSKSDLLLSLDLPFFSNTKDLKDFRYRGFNAGLSALSSLVSYRRHSNPDLSENSILLRDMLRSGISVYEFCLKVLKKERPSLVYVFNGRFVTNRAILDAAIEIKAPYLVHERGADKTRYTANPYMPHDFRRVRESISAAWNHGGGSAVEMAELFFRERREGRDQGWVSFTKNQEKGLLKFDRASKSRLVTYFSSSDDEYVAVGDIVKWDRWPDQLSAVKSLLKVVARRPMLHLIIRLHPHLLHKDSRDTERWLSLELPENARVILPGHPTDTYELIEQSDVVVTSGSTTGIEAVYWGTPSICLGPSLYSDLGAVYLPADEVELEELLLSTNLTVDNDRALPYGYFMRTFGETFAHYKADTLFSGRFMGVNLQQSGFCGFVRRSLALVNGVLSRLIRLIRRVFFIFRPERLTGFAK